MIAWITKIMMFVSAALVAAFTIPRTLHFIEHALPPEDKLYAYFALAAFDLGIVVWTLYLIRGARSIPQFGIAAVMVVACVAGVITTLGADMVLNAQTNGLISANSPELAQTAIYACVGIFAFNIVAKIGITVTEPEILERIKDALTQAHITDAYFKEIDARAKPLAKELADRRAAEWVDSMGYLTDRHIEQQRKAREVIPPAPHKSSSTMSPLDHARALTPARPPEHVAGNGNGADPKNGQGQP